MNQYIVFAVIAVQVVVFQFLAAGWVRAMLGFRLGLRDLPPDAARSLAEHNRRAAVAWRALGALLWLAAVALAFLPGLAYAQRKIGLAAVSLASSARLVAHILVPPPALRSASLEPRRLEHYYAVSLEAVPTLAFAATVSVTILAMRGLLPGVPASFGATAEGASLWIDPLGQLVFIIGGALAARGILHGQALLSQVSRASLGDAAMALRIEDTLRRVKLRGLLAVRIAIAVMFALMQLRRLYAPLDHGSWLAMAAWGMVALILGLFAALMLRLAGLRKSIS
jgi:hypothetical protein